MNTALHYFDGSTDPNAQQDWRENAEADEWAVMLKAPVLHFTPAPHGPPITKDQLAALLRRPPARRRFSRRLPEFR